MRRNLPIIVGFIIVCLLASYFNLPVANAAWRNLVDSASYDNISNTGYVQAQDFKLDSNGNPFVVWVNDDSSGSGTSLHVYFSKWTPGTGWTDMAESGPDTYDSITNGYDTASYPMLKLDTSNNPNIIWKSHSNIYFTKWTVGAGEDTCGGGIQDCWTHMDGITSGSENMSQSGWVSDQQPILQLDASNNPYVAWVDHGSESERVYLRKWSGSDWTKMNGTSGHDTVNTGNYVDSNMDMRLDSNALPQIIWIDSPNSNLIFTKYTGGVGWTKMDSILGRDQIIINTDTAIDANFRINSLDIPYIVWTNDDTSDRQVYFSTWDETNGWSTMAGDAGHDDIAGSQNFSNVGIEVYNDTPYVYWFKQSVGYSNLYLTKWTSGTGWTDMSGGKQCAYGSNDGTACTNNSSCTGGGVCSGFEKVDNRDTGYSMSSAVLRFDSLHRPNICWGEEDTSTSNKNIQFTKWSGSAWVKMDGNAGIDQVTDTNHDSLNYMEIKSNDSPFFLWQDVNSGSSDILFTNWYIAGLPPANGQILLTADVEAFLTLSLSSTSCNLGTFDAAQVNTCNYSSIISTNGTSGYSAWIRADGDLRNSSSSLANVLGGTVSAGTEAYGITTTQDSMGITRIDDVNTDSNYTAADCTALNGGSTSATATVLTTSDQSFGVSSGPADAETTNVCHIASISATTPAGSYSQTVTITVIGNF